jgi:hypothetical protein
MAVAGGSQDVFSGVLAVLPRDALPKPQRQRRGNDVQVVVGELRAPRKRKVSNNPAKKPPMWAM